MPLPPHDYILFVCNKFVETLAPGCALCVCEREYEWMCVCAHTHLLTRYIMMIIWYW